MTPWRDGTSPRRMIVEAAARVFAAHGYAAGSLNTIASEVGISRQLLLHYFPNKEAVLEAVLQQRVRRSPWPDPARLPLSTFLDDIDQLFALDRDERERTRLSHRLRAEADDARHPAYDWVRVQEREAREMLRTVYAGAIDRGELPFDTDARALAVTTLAAVEGIERQHLAEPELDGAAAVDALRRLFRALATAPPDPARRAPRARPAR